MFLGSWRVVEGDYRVLLKFFYYNSVYVLFCLTLNFFSLINYNFLFIIIDSIDF